VIDTLVTRLGSLGIDVSGLTPYFNGTTLEDVTSVDFYSTADGQELFTFGSDEGAPWPNLATYAPSSGDEVPFTIYTYDGTETTRDGGSIRINPAATSVKGCGIGVNASAVLPGGDGAWLKYGDSVGDCAKGGDSGTAQDPGSGGYFSIRMGRSGEALDTCTAAAGIKPIASTLNGARGSDTSSLTTTPGDGGDVTMRAGAGGADNTATHPASMGGDFAIGGGPDGDGQFFGTKSGRAVINMPACTSTGNGFTTLNDPLEIESSAITDGFIIVNLTANAAPTFPDVTSYPNSNPGDIWRCGLLNDSAFVLDLSDADGFSSGGPLVAAGDYCEFVQVNDAGVLSTYVIY
jgi:hypothetical protein